MKIASYDDFLDQEDYLAKLVNRKLKLEEELAKLDKEINELDGTLDEYTSSYLALNANPDPFQKGYKMYLDTNHQTQKAMHALSLGILTNFGLQCYAYSIASYVGEKKYSTYHIKTQDASKTEDIVGYMKEHGYTLILAMHTPAHWNEHPYDNCNHDCENCYLCHEDPDTYLEFKKD